eukprot:scaffold7572_cov118-Cylindrotheca_fusiformis.AAC.4
MGRRLLDVRTSRLFHTYASRVMPVLGSFCVQKRERIHVRSNHRSTHAEKLLKQSGSIDKRERVHSVRPTHQAATILFYKTRGRKRTKQSPSGESTNRASNQQHVSYTAVN